MLKTNTEVKTIKRGRPTIPGSARQARLARWEALKTQGFTVRAGRPKGSTKKATEIATEILQNLGIKGSSTVDTTATKSK
jgi:hypothetical protein